MRRKLFSCAIIVLVVLGLLTSLAYFHWTNGVYVSISNNTEKTFRQIDIVYTGGSARIASLEPNASYGQYVNPHGESDLKIECFDSSGASHSYTVDTYIEHNYSGSIHITMEPDDKMSAVDNTRATFWF